MWYIFFFVLLYFNILFTTNWFVFLSIPYIIIRVPVFYFYWLFEKLCLCVSNIIEFKDWGKKFPTKNLKHSTAPNDNNHISCVELWCDVRCVMIKCLKSTCTLHYGNLKTYQTVQCTASLDLWRRSKDRPKPASECLWKINVGAS